MKEVFILYKSISQLVSNTKTAKTLNLCLVTKNDCFSRSTVTIKIKTKIPFKIFMLLQINIKIKIFLKYKE